MRKQILFSLVMVLIVVGMLGVVSAEVLVSDAGVEYDAEIPDIFSNQTFAEEMLEKAGVEYESGILEILNNQTWVRLLIRLKDNSGIEIIGTKEEKIELMRQRDELFKPIIENVLSDLSESEIKEIRRRSDGFSAKVTEENFNKLIDDLRVRKIMWPKEKVRLYQNNFNINNLYAYIGVILTILIIIWIILKSRKIKK